MPHISNAVIQGVTQGALRIAIGAAGILTSAAVAASVARENSDLVLQGLIESGQLDELVRTVAIQAGALGGLYALIRESLDVFARQQDPDTVVTLATIAAASLISVGLLSMPLLRSSPDTDRNILMDGMDLGLLVSGAQTELLRKVMDAIVERVEAYLLQRPEPIAQAEEAGVELGPLA